MGWVPCPGNGQAVGSVTRAAGFPLMNSSLQCNEVILSGAQACGTSPGASNLQTKKGARSGAFLIRGNRSG